MWVTMNLEIPPELREGASVLWSDNGRPISTGSFDAQSVLWTPGVHAIEARVALADDRRAVLRRAITVLPPPSSQPASQ